jgi:GR25 family glycosyltransferase involved in LPS biosynthesis
MKIYAISLLDSPRRKRIREIMCGIPCEFVDGVRITLEQREIWCRDHGVARLLQTGDIGCTLAHIEAMKTALRNMTRSENLALILEDDAEPLVSDWLEHVKKLERDAPIAQVQAYILHRFGDPEVTVYGNQAIAYNRAALALLLRNQRRLMQHHIDIVLHARADSPLKIPHFNISAPLELFTHSAPKLEQSERLAVNDAARKPWLATQ